MLFFHINLSDSISEVLLRIDHGVHLFCGKGLTEALGGGVGNMVFILLYAYINMHIAVFIILFT